MKVNTWNPTGNIKNRHRTSRRATGALRRSISIYLEVIGDIFIKRTVWLPNVWDFVYRYAIALTCNKWNTDKYIGTPFYIFSRVTYSSGVWPFLPTHPELNRLAGQAIKEMTANFIAIRVI